MRFVRSPIFLIIGACILVTLLHYTRILSPVERAVRFVFSPATKQIYQWEQELKTPPLPFSTVAELVEAYQVQQDQLRDYTALEARNTILAEENAALRLQLDFRSQTEATSVGADVIGKSVDSLTSAIIVNQGRTAGVREGQAVIVGEGILVGRIARVNTDTAVVRLLKDEQSRIAASVLNTDRSLGLVEGGYGLSVHMNLIPQQERIAVDDIVVTSGLEDDMPRGLIIGTIRAVEKEAYAPFQEAVLTPAADLDRLRVVSIIIPQ